MTIMADRQWHLSGRAEAQMTECGIALSELYRLLRGDPPVMRLPGGSPGQTRLNGFGLSAVVSGNDVLSVGIDGATSENWSEWAAERAAFGDGDVVEADKLVRTDATLYATSETPGFMPRQGRERKKKRQSLMVITHVLDRVHPQLHEEITRQVAGDFSRLVIHSKTRVTILPKRG